MPPICLCTVLQTDRGELSARDHNAAPILRFRLLCRSLRRRHCSPRKSCVSYIRGPSHIGGLSDQPRPRGEKSSGSGGARDRLANRVSSQTPAAQGSDKPCIAGWGDGRSAPQRRSTGTLHVVEPFGSVGSSLIADAVGGKVQRHGFEGGALERRRARWLALLGARR
jgi:hypothetical protein